ncbi:MAG: glycosyltransferase, partial [Candidatus Omnitrophota bacterium]|nr:glycosyltransferase [Candidatus Omnitrophota bacterium]
MRAVIIPNDPIKAYLKKGEMIERYFNPENIFDRIDIVSLADSDVEPASVQHLAGKARLNIQPVGRISLLRALFPGTYVRRITRAVDVMGADVIIAHNSNVAGFVAARLGKMFRIPVVICMHTNPDKDIRAHISWKDIKRKLFWLYSSVLLENYALKYSSKVICAYNFITSYLISRGVEPGRIKVIYHRIDVEKFKRRSDLTGPKSNEKLRILCVGRVFERKNPENIIRAIKNLNAHLTIIGDGNLLPGLIKLS